MCLLCRLSEQILCSLPHQPSHLHSVEGKVNKTTKWYSMFSFVGREKKNSGIAALTPSFQPEVLMVVFWVFLIYIFGCVGSSLLRAGFL